MKAFLAAVGIAFAAFFIFLSGCTAVAPPNCINVTCNGITACRAPDNIPPCVPIVPPGNSSLNSTQPCPDGYKCGIAADGCAVPGAIYNCPNEPVPNITAGSGIAVSLEQELNNSANAGFSLSENMFRAGSLSECLKVLIGACDNNVPGQFICINQQYAGTVSSQYDRIYVAPGACPMFMLAGTVSCGLDGGYCVVVR